ncbi:MAG TPA: reverse transcriptase family protein, partial [Gemmatimonadetes bacterium]|nr:reverse transcriptase family protein [Gemmatimonadota bacterium]
QIQAESETPVVEVVPPPVVHEPVEAGPTLGQVASESFHRVLVEFRDKESPIAGFIPGEKGSAFVGVNMCQDDLNRGWENWVSNAQRAAGIERRVKRANKTSTSRPSGVDRETSALNVRSNPRVGTPNRTQRRKRWRAEVQSRFERDPGTTTKDILGGNSITALCDPGTLAEHWKKVFSSESVVDPRRPKPPVAGCMWSLWAPITLNELKGALAGTKHNTPGSDQLGKRELLRLEQSDLLAWFNLWLFSGRLPSQLTRADVTLIPKCDMAAAPAQYRPIAVCSKILRLFHSILSKRFRTVALPEEQRGFRPQDGTFESTWLLKTILDSARQKPKATFVAFVDISNAFGSVSHDTLLKACVHIGLPPPLIRYVETLYSQFTVKIKGGTGDEVKVGCGILQGDPLSSDLFNFAMAFICQELDRKVGYSMEKRIAGTDSLLSYASYADDTFLIAETREGLRMLAGQLEGSLWKAGLTINASKSATLAIDVAGTKTKTWYCSPQPFIDLGGRRVPALSVSGTYKYLGVNAGARGFDNSSIKPYLVTRLERLQRASLKPQQRLYAVRQHLIPALYHGLILGGSKAGALKDLDCLIRKRIRSWLHLPHDVPMGVFYASIGQGGLGLPCLATKIPTLRSLRMGRLQNTDQENLKKVVESEVGQKLATKDLTRPRLDVADHRVSAKIAENQHWSGKLHGSVDGRGLNQHGRVPAAHAWMRDPSLRISGGEFIRALHTRLACLKTPLRAARRGAERTSAMCRSCADSVCSLGHILQVCPRTHGLRVKRHNDLVKMLVTALKRQNYEVIEEPHFRLERSFCKPDIVAIKRGQVLVLDPTIVADGFPFCEAMTTKERLYGNDEVLQQVQLMYKERFGSVPAGETPPRVIVSGVAVNWRGGWDFQSWAVLTKTARIPPRYLILASIRVLCSGWSAWAATMRRTN